MHHYTVGLIFGRRILVTDYVMTRRTDQDTNFFTSLRILQMLQSFGQAIQYTTYKNIWTYHHHL